LLEPAIAGDSLVATVAYGLGQMRVNKEYQQTVTLQAEIMATLKLIDRLILSSVNREYGKQTGKSQTGSGRQEERKKHSMSTIMEQ
jgi:hypothetical protein